MKPNLPISKKHYQQDGHWIVKPKRTEILICTCGNKYIKTRPNQTVCIRCIIAPVTRPVIKVKSKR